MNRIKIHWLDERMEPSILDFDEKLKCSTTGHRIGSYFEKSEHQFTIGGKKLDPIGTCTDCLRQGVDEQASIKSIEWWQDGTVGGFTFKDGHASKIYQCGECGVYLEYNTTYNKHKKESHGAKDSVQFGWADGEPDWQELKIDESQIIKGDPK